MSANETDLVPEVRGARHVAEQTDLHNAREHLNRAQELHPARPSFSTKSERVAERRGAYGIGICHHFGRERRVDHEVAIVRHDGPSLVDGHAELRGRRAEDLKVVQQLRVRERRYLDGDAFKVLCGSWGEDGDSRSAEGKARRRGGAAHVRREDLGVFAVVGNHDEAAGGVLSAGRAHDGRKGRTFLRPPRAPSHADGTLRHP